MDSKNTYEDNGAERENFTADGAEENQARVSHVVHLQVYVSQPGTKMSQGLSFHTLWMPQLELD